MNIILLLCFLVVIDAFQFKSNLRVRSFNKIHNLGMTVTSTTTEISMPALSSTMTEGKIVEWTKNEGDFINAGDVIMVVESDKADMDVEAFEEGYLAKILTQAGESASVGAVVALVVADPSDIDNVDNIDSSSTTSASTPIEAEAVSFDESPVMPSTADVIGRSIDMPALSSTMKEGKIVSWALGVGDQVSAGDVLLVVESDKADMDVEAFEDGYISEIIVPEGGTAEVGKPVAIIVDNEADVGKGSVSGTSERTTSVPTASAASIASTTTTPNPISTTTTTTTNSNTGTANGDYIRASGWVRTLAKEKGIDLSTIAPSRSDGLLTAKDLIGAAEGVISRQSLWTPAPGVIPATPTAKRLAKENKLDIMNIAGTGNFGRVTADDVLIAAGKKEPPAPKAVSIPKTSSTATASAIEAPTSSDKKTEVLDGIVPMDGMQKAVAKNMEATLSVPIFRVSREIYTDDFDALYAKLKPKGVSVSAMLAKAVAVVLQKHPIVNAGYVEGGIKYNKDANIAMAVAIDGGLITPTIIGAQSMDIFQVGEKWRELVGKAKDKKLSPAEYSSGTFTISNLGMFGVQQFDAILPPGTGSILAIAASTPKVVQLSNGYYGVRKSMTVTITCDHRHIYGADAAEFLKDLADLLENNARDIAML